MMGHPAGKHLKSDYSFSMLKDCIINTCLKQYSDLSNLSLNHLFAYFLFCNKTVENRQNIACICLKYAILMLLGRQKRGSYTEKVAVSAPKIRKMFEKRVREKHDFYEKERHFCS